MFILLCFQEGIRILRRLEGFNMRFSTGKIGPDPTYVVTIDNLLKMLAIQLRLRNGLPILVMGETGCGKSKVSDPDSNPKRTLTCKASPNPIPDYT